MNTAPLRLIFMGTPAFSVPTLQALVNSRHQVVAVYSQPPRPSGRGHQVQKSPVHQLAEERGVLVLGRVVCEQDRKIVGRIPLAADAAADAVVVAPAVLTRQRVVDRGLLMLDHAVELDGEAAERRQVEVQLAVVSAVVAVAGADAAAAAAGV